MTVKIVEKIKSEINRGIDTEAQVLYILASIRKIIEQENLSKQYRYLEFHCNWVLHSVLKGTFVQNIIKEFDFLHREIMEGYEFPANSEVRKISGMEYLQMELNQFLQRFGIRRAFQDLDDWAKFIYFYTLIIEDTSLRIRVDNTARVKEIVVSVKNNDEILKPHRFFKVTWYVTDNNGKVGEIFFLHSYENI